VPLQNYWKLRLSITMPPLSAKNNPPLPFYVHTNPLYTRHQTGSILHSRLIKPSEKMLTLKGFSYDVNMMNPPEVSTRTASSLQPELPYVKLCNCVSFTELRCPLLCDFTTDCRLVLGACNRSNSNNNNRSNNRKNWFSRNYITLYWEDV
jgi:hypothetical protein